MVPHLKVEEAVYAVVPEGGCAVIGIPDESRGERLVLLYTNRENQPQQLWQALAKSALPRLWLPKQENIHQVETLPALGTGKLDLRAVKALAQSLSCSLERV